MARDCGTAQTIEFGSTVLLRPILIPSFLASGFGGMFSQVIADLVMSSMIARLPDCCTWLYFPVLQKATMMCICLAPSIRHLSSDDYPSSCKTQQTYAE